MISLTYAGAGGGKTTNMVDSIVEKLSSLPSNRYLCVVTYTNDAANSIQKKLAKITNIPSNVFIGTIHSFLFRFVFKPHVENGANYTIVSELPKKEEVIKGFIAWANNKIIDREKRKIIINSKWNIRKKEIYEKLTESDLITYDYLVSSCRDLTKKAKVRKTLSNKIKYLYVDEYQDTYKWLHEVFLQIHKGGKTDLHVIGDPNQSIYGFSYGSSENGARRPQSFSEFPIIQMKECCDNFSELSVNYRSSMEIVKLANLYNTSIQQVPHNTSFESIMAIETNDTDETYRLFNHKRIKLGLTGNAFILSKNNNSLIPYKTKITLDDQDNNKRCIREVEACIAQYLGLSINNACYENRITRMQFRSLAVTVGKEKEIVLSTIITAFEEKFGRKPVFIEQDLQRANPKKIEKNVEVKALTIHKSKGLEAESVLLIFDSNNHIKKSFIEKRKMVCHKDDGLRLVYVGITRAQKLLVIACKEKISKESKSLLEKHNIQFIDSSIS